MSTKASVHGRVMSKAIFVANARKQFTEFASVWFDFLLEHFPGVRTQRT